MKPRLKQFGDLWRASLSSVHAYATTPLGAQLQLDMEVHRLVVEYRDSWKVFQSLALGLEDWTEIWWHRETEIERARLRAEQQDQLSPSPEHSATSETRYSPLTSATGQRIDGVWTLDSAQPPSCTQSSTPLPVAFRLVPGTAGNTLADMLGIVGLIEQKPEHDSNGSET